MRHEMTPYCYSDRRSNTRWRQFLHRCDPPRIAGGESLKRSAVAQLELAMPPPWVNTNKSRDEMGDPNALEAKRAQTGRPKTVSRRGRGGRAPRAPPRPVLERRLRRDLDHHRGPLGGAFARVVDRAVGAGGVDGEAVDPVARDRPGHV